MLAFIGDGGRQGPHCFRQIPEPGNMYVGFKLGDPRVTMETSTVPDRIGMKQAVPTTEARALSAHQRIGGIRTAVGAPVSFTDHRFVGRDGI